MPTNPFRDIMSDEAWEASRAWADRPAREKWDDLVRAGIIDEQGEVLIRKPTFGPDEDDDAAEGAEAPAREAT